MTSLRQSFLNGALTRLLDPDTTLRKKVVEFVERGDFGLGSGPKADGTYERFWHGERIDPSEVAFESGVFLLTRAKAQALKAQPATEVKPELEQTTALQDVSEPDTVSVVEQTDEAGPDLVSDDTPQATRLVLEGNIPAEVWNRLGTRLLTRLRTGEDVQIDVRFGVTVKPEAVANLEAELRQALLDLGLQDRLQVKRG